MIDTHSHLDGEEFRNDIDNVIKRAKEAGIEKIFVPAICQSELDNLLQLCNKHKGYLYPMVGLHPENIFDSDYHEQLAYIEQHIDQSIAIGEVGLDLYWDDTHLQEQLEVFETQIQWAEKHNLPLMIHARSAHKELVEIMNRHRSSNLSGVFHCFTGTEDEARELLTFTNFMIGIGGVLTFKKSSLPATVANAIPLTRIVLETDSPYMAPVPHRGKRNESAYVKEVAAKLASIFGITIEEVNKQTTLNALKVFQKVKM